MMNIILFGAPGAGKGTQASLISKKLGIPTVSTGNIIRDAISRGTQAGLEAKEYVDRGELVPDEAVIRMLKDRISREDCSKGYILDGFPRTIAQAQALSEMGVSVDKVIFLEVDDEVIEKRMSGRRVCPKCGETYHIINNPPKSGSVCDRCGTGLVQREDDKPETVGERLRVYHEQTEPLKEYYEKKNMLTQVDGSGKVEDTAAQIFKALGC
jgi:adenylate kinase